MNCKMNFFCIIYALKPRIWAQRLNYREIQKFNFSSGPMCVKSSKFVCDFAHGLNVNWSGVIKDLNENLYLRQLIDTKLIKKLFLCFL